MTTPASNGRVTTFYSYKGGTGRTMAIANVAALLAIQNPTGRGVLAIDWDLEAPGLHRYFASRVAADESAAFERRPGLVDWFVDARDRSGARRRAPGDGASPAPPDLPDLDGYLTRCGFGPLWIMKAGRLDESYAQTVRTFDWKGLFERNPEVFTGFRETVTRRFEHVLVDSRTGISDVSGICTTLLPERLVIVFTPNSQSLMGGLQAARSAVEYRRASEDLRPLLVMPLPSRVDDAEKDLQKQWRYGAPRESVPGYQPEFARLFQDLYDLESCDLSSYFDEVQVQHVPRYAYGEQIAVLQERVGDRLSQARSYQTFLAHLLAEHPPWETAVGPSASIGSASGSQHAAGTADGEALPYPVAVMLRKAQNARSGVDRHEAAYAAWEVSVRLTLAGNPPAETHSLARGTIGNWIRSMEADEQPIAVEEISRAYVLLREGAGEKGIPDEVTARRLLDALPAYRDRVLGQGTPRSEEYYESAARILVDGVRRAWSAGVFWPSSSHLMFRDPERTGYVGRTILLDGELPTVVQDPTAPTSRHGAPTTATLSRDHRGTSQSLEPWCVFEDNPTTPVVWFLTAADPAPTFVNPVTGDRRSLAELSPVRPELEAEVRATFAEGGGGPDVPRTPTPLQRTPLRLGRYQVERALGSGAVGTVFLARDLALRRHVAIKVLRETIGNAPADEARRRRFQREIEALSRVQSPYVVRILDVGTQDEHPFLTMEYLDGLTARDHMERIAERSVPERVHREAARVIRDAARGVHDLHVNGILHRDLKPSNIMVADDGRRVVVMDLGLASVAEAAMSTTGTGEIIGTPRYMAPERFGDQEVVGPRTDVYALGASLFELATGKRLFDAPDMHELIFRILGARSANLLEARASLPNGLLRVIEKAAARDPADRHETAEALASELEAFLAAPASSATDPAESDRATAAAATTAEAPAARGLPVTLDARPRRRPRSLVVAALVLAAAVTAIVMTLIL